jgi:hypothetical protein
MQLLCFQSKIILSIAQHDMLAMAVASAKKETEKHSVVQSKPTITVSKKMLTSLSDEDMRLIFETLPSEISSNFSAILENTVQAEIALLSTATARKPAVKSSSDTSTTCNR